jgi:hypothetical protein
VTFFLRRPPGSSGAEKGRPVLGANAAVAAIPVAIVLFKLTKRKPRIFFGDPGKGVLTRHLPMLEEGWGVISIWGKLRVQ